MLSQDNVWYGRLKLLFTMSVKIDGQKEPIDMECAYVSFSMKSSWNLLARINV